MTTRSQTVNPVTGAPAGAADAGATLSPWRRFCAACAEAFALLARNWRWVFILVPYAFAWWAPAFWKTKTWWAIFDSNSLLAFQPFVPVGVALLLWSRRAQIRARWEHLNATYTVHHPKRRGNFGILVFACLLLLFGFFVQVKGIAFAALALLPVGVVYGLYGRIMVREMAAPLLFAFTMIPPPDTLILGLMTRALVGSVAAAGALLHLLHYNVNVVGWTIHFPGYAVPIDMDCNGLSSVVSLFAVLSCYFIYRRARANLAISIMALGGVLIMLLNILRIALVAAFYSRDPSLSETLEHLNGWIFVFFATVLMLLLVHNSGRLEHTGVAAAQPVQQAVNVVGNGLGMAISPVVALLSSLGKIGTLWTRSEKGLERLLKRLMPRGGRKRKKW